MAGKGLTLRPTVGGFGEINNKLITGRLGQSPDGDSNRWLEAYLAEDGAGEVAEAPSAALSEAGAAGLRRRSGIDPGSSSN